MVYWPWLQTEPAAGSTQDTLPPVSPTPNDVITSTLHDAILNASRVCISLSLSGF